MTTLKLIVNSITRTSSGSTIKMQADYANDKNKEWSKYTPAANLEFTVKPELEHLFELGTSFTVTLEAD